MRLSKIEKRALKSALKDFDGEVYIFGSRVDMHKKGGDIDLMLIPAKRINSLELILKIQCKFFSLCEEDIDIAVYNDDDHFSKEVMKNAEKISIKTI